MGELEPAEAAPILEVRGLTKRYGRVEALRGLDLTVRPGEVYGFLGRNGAGKSSTIRILMGITPASGGEVRLFGSAARGQLPLRQRIGYVAQDQSFYGWMTPRTIGRFVRGFYPTWDDAEYTRLIGAMELPERRIRELSGGMRTKLALALALAHRPPLLILDEPTAGLDPVARREFLDMVREQAERSGRTTFFSTHLLDEVERVADRVGIVDQGRTLYEGGLERLAGTVRRLVHDVGPDRPPLPLPEALQDAARGFRVLQDRTRRGRREVVVWARTSEDLQALLAALDAAGREPAPGEEALAWESEEMSLEEIFVDMVARAAAV